MRQSTHVVVLGGGYAGLMAAMRLAKKTRPEVAITLVNAGVWFYERVRNHQVAAGQPVGRYPLASLLRGTRIGFVQGAVTDLDPAARRVTLRGAGDAGENVEGQTIGYDWLVYALGSTSQTGGIPGAREHAYTLDHPSVTALAACLPEIERSHGRVLVIGGGPTGVELATEMAESHPDAQVTLVTRREVVPRFSRGARAHVRRSLAQLGIALAEQAAIAEVRPDAARASDGRRFPFDAAVLTGGFGVSDLARRSGLRVNALGQILTDRTLRSLSHGEIYAVGDAAMPAEEPGAPVRMSVITSLFMGAHGADSLAARLRGRRPAAFGISYIAAGISLGRHNGVVQFLDWNRDTPLRTILTGRLAVRFREFFVGFALWAIKAQRVAPWVFDWPGRRKMRRLPVVVPAGAPAPRIAARTAVPADTAAGGER
ncbi:MAG TPA: FAD-dependent oxidoreductase [bacterium]|nr:FAD-dependent oxidoreductase [bacterium]